MSQENVEIVRHLLETLDREELDGHVSGLHPDIEWTTTGAFIEPATYRGHEEVRRYLGLMFNEFENLRNEPLELIDAGEQVVVVSRISGRGKQSGAPVELMLTTVGSFRDGKVVRIRNYQNEAEAFEAAGLRE